MKTKRKTQCGILTILLIAGLTASVTASPVDREECEKVKQQIRELQARMRNGYTAAQGIRYGERMRKLKDKRYKVCR